MVSLSFCINADTAMASPTLITPTNSKPKPPLSLIKSKLTAPNATLSTAATSSPQLRRRQLTSLAATILSHGLLSAVAPALAESDEEYVKDTKEVIDKVRTTINMDKNDPNTAAAVAGLREASNSWVAKYRREKALLGRVSFRDIYSALNAVSGHYISFGPTAPIPAKRKARVLEEMDTAEKALELTTLLFRQGFKQMRCSIKEEEEENMRGIRRRRRTSGVLGFGN